jgi:hypothetical protein
MGQWARQAALPSRMGLLARSRTHGGGGEWQRQAVSVSVSTRRLGRDSDASELTPVRSNPPRTGLGCEYLTVGAYGFKRLVGLSITYVAGQ